jgi:hypothetical protein
MQFLCYCWRGRANGVTTQDIQHALGPSSGVVDRQGPRSVGSRPNDNPTTLASVVRHGGMRPCTLQVGQVRLPVSAHPSPLFGSCLMREAACRFVVLDLLFDMYPARCGGLRAYGSRFKLLSSIHHKRVPVCLNFHLNGRFFHVKKDVEISSEQFC